MLDRLPRITFVLGKGGVGRSSVAAALGATRAARGERVLVLEWTVAEAMAPWFGLPPAGVVPVEIAENLFVADGSLFPSSIGGPPQLSIYALGLHVGRAIARS